MVFEWIRKKWSYYDWISIHFNFTSNNKKYDILLKKALESKHYIHAEECFRFLLEGYKKENKDFATILRRLDKVEKRGHYKQKWILG